MNIEMFLYEKHLRVSYDIMFLFLSFVYIMDTHNESSDTQDTQSVRLCNWTCPRCRRNFKREVYLRKHLAKKYCSSEKDAILAFHSEPASPQNEPIADIHKIQLEEIEPYLQQIENNIFHIRQWILKQNNSNKI